MLTKEAIVNLLQTSDAAVARALVALNARQTPEEQMSEATIKHNSMGFRPCHARMGTSMAQFYLARGYLSPKQITYWRAKDKTGKMRIEIYAGQLLIVAQEKAAAKEAAETKLATNVVVVEDIGNAMESTMVLQQMAAGGEPGAQDELDRFMSKIKSSEPYRKASNGE